MAHRSSGKQSRQAFLYRSRSHFEASGELYDALDADVAELFVKNPGLSTRKAVVELEKRGHSKVNEEVVRQRKKRLGLSKSFPLQIVTKPPG